MLSLQSLLGISGPLLATIIGSRFGIKNSLTIGIIASGPVYFAMLLLPTSKIAYTTSAIFIGATYFYALA